MITIFKTGTYKLTETKNNTKILHLDDDAYIWISAKKIGQVLVANPKTYRTDRVISAGNYIIYDVEDEPYLTDLQHLELEYGVHAWQGYLLTTGLPDDKKKRSRIIPTQQLITGIPYFSNKIGFRRWLAASGPTIPKSVVGGRV